MDCNTDACRAYKKYTAWIESIPKDDRFKQDIVAKLQQVARESNVEVHEMVAHKQCHQPEQHTFAKSNKDFSRKVYR